MAQNNKKKIDLKELRSNAIYVMFLIGIAVAGVSAVVCLIHLVALVFTFAFWLGLLSVGLIIIGLAFAASAIFDNED